MVYNAVLIDEYNRCIFGETEVALTNNMNTTSGDASLKRFEKRREWEAGMNARAPFRSGYDDEGEYYEAKILKIYDGKFAAIEFFGYDGEHVVKLDELEKSEGEKAIEEQIEWAKQEYEKEEEDEDNDYDEEQINWAVGMPCRAYYKPMDLIYEATIEKVDSTNETVMVSMTGYNITYTVDFSDLYRSDPILREKQIRSAAKHETAAGKIKYQEPTSHCQMTLESRPSQSASVSNIHSPHHQQKIMQPKDEREALACLVSANYLYGYYAGYYDCMKKKEQCAEK